MGVALRASSVATQPFESTHIFDIQARQPNKPIGKLRHLRTLDCVRQIGLPFWRDTFQGGGP
jgi:hypothetical protein